MDNFGSKVKKGLVYLWRIIITIPIVIIYLPLVAIVNFVWRKILRKQNKIEWVINPEIQTGTLAYLRDNWVGDSNTAQNNRVFFGFVFPALGAFILMVIIPFLMGIYYSFTDWTGLNNDDLNFVFLKHYGTLLTDVKFFYSFSRTVIYSALNIVVINIVAFGLALLVTQKLKLKNLYRAGFFMPNLIGGLVLGYIWQFIFNRAIVEFGGVFEQSLLVNGNSALLGLIIVVTWQYAGYIMMIYIAAIQNIPQDLIEASRIDGASAMQRLQTITFPLVAQAFTVAMFLTLVTSFKQFDTVVSLSDGGPAMLLPQWIADIYGIQVAPAVDSLNFIAIDIYKEAFSNYNMALGQAKAIIFFIILLIISLVQVNYNKKREVEL